MIHTCKMHTDYIHYKMHSYKIQTVQQNARSRMAAVIDAYGGRCRRKLLIIQAVLGAETNKAEAERWMGLCRGTTGGGGKADMNKAEGER